MGKPRPWNCLGSSKIRLDHFNDWRIFSTLGRSSLNFLMRLRFTSRCLISIDPVLADIGEIRYDHAALGESCNDVQLATHSLDERAKIRNVHVSASFKLCDSWLLYVQGYPDSLLGHGSSLP